MISEDETRNAFVVFFRKLSRAGLNGEAVGAAIDERSGRSNGIVATVLTLLGKERKMRAARRLVDRRH